MATFNVNTDAAIKFSAKLERLHRSAFPVAVRQTLNDAAFMTKSMVPRVAGQKFTTRQRNFFRAFSVVNKATGFRVNGMVAVAGINADKGDKVAEGLEQQEKGGTIQGRKLIPHDMGRVSGSYGKKLRSKYRFRNIDIATKRNAKAGSKFVLIKNGAKGTVFEIKQLKTRRKLTPVYVYRRTKKSNVQRRPFMEPSAMFARSKLNAFYAKHAERQFKKYLS